MKNLSFLEFLKEVFKQARFKVVSLIVFVILAGGLEGIGFTLFIPLISVITISSQSAAGFANNDFLHKLFTSTGLGSSLPLLLFFVILVTAAKNVFLYFQKVFTARISTDFEVELKKDISASVFASDWQFYLNQKIGTLVNAFGNAVKTSAMAFQVQVQLCAEILNVALYCAVGLLISWQAFIMSMLAGLAYANFSRNIIKRSRSIGQEEVDTGNDIQRRILEDFTGIKVIKGNRLEEERKSGLFALINKLGALVFKREKYIAILDTFPELIMVIAMCAIFYISYAHLHVPGENLLVLLAILYRFNKRIMAVQNLRQRLLNYIPSYELCSGIIEEAGKLKEITGEKKFYKLQEGIKFDRVKFSYTNQPVLKSVSFEIKKCSFAAFVGKSGSGKTTILDLITGLLKPQGGSSTIDGCDIGEYDIFSWRRQIGYVPQEPFLINGTIAENIQMGNLSASMPEIINAAKLANADEFIDALPDGYRTLVGDRGIKLSGGQRQRIALARALVRNPELLILDEATSALDNKSEKMIQEAINKLKGKLTIIVVAHRLTTILAADVVYMLSEGRITESGRIEDLKVSSSAFKEIYNLE